MARLENPFTGEVDEIDLGERAPLQRGTSICQMRFAPEPALGSDETVGQLRKKLSDEFPHTEKHVSIGVQVDMTKNTARQEEIVSWRFSNEAGETAIVAQDFIALESTSYRSRDRFREQFDLLLTEVRDVAPISRYTRLGLRYINRFVGESTLDTIPKLLAPQLTGALAYPDGGLEIGLLATQNFASFELDPIAVSVRSGFAPPGEALNGMSALEEFSWHVDIDCFHSPGEPQNLEGVSAMMETLATTGYRFFRWAVDIDPIRDGEVSA